MAAGQRNIHGGIRRIRRAKVRISRRVRRARRQPSPLREIDEIAMKLEPRLVHCAGIVISGKFSRSPVSASVNSINMNANTRFDFRSRSSIQNECPR